MGIESNILFANHQHKLVKRNILIAVIANENLNSAYYIINEKLVYKTYKDF